MHTLMVVFPQSETCYSHKNPTTCPQFGAGFQLENHFDIVNRIHQPPFAEHYSIGKIPVKGSEWPLHFSEYH